MTWKHYTCEISGKAASVLIDERFAHLTPVKELPRLSWFGIYCNQPTGVELWNPEETDALEQIEDDLIRLLEMFGHGWAVYVLRVTTRGIREYYVYHADRAELSKAVSALKGIYPNYRIVFETTDDMAWEQYGRYISYPPTGY